MSKLFNVINEKFFYLSSLAKKYMEFDIELQYEMEPYTAGSPQWCMYELKRFNLVNDFKNAIKNYKHEELNEHNQKINCSRCNLLLIYNKVSNDYICHGCGYTKQCIDNSIYTFNDFKNYSKNCVHHYKSQEHFSQTLCDFANIGRRNVPVVILNICKLELGRGVHISSNDVYNVLQKHKFRSHYQYKYEITNTLRGKREFILTSMEIEDLRSLYNRYHLEIIPFQIREKIGSVSSRGKPRLFWPMRFILSKLCEKINRKDLIKYIRPVSCKKRLQQYNFYWDKLINYIDNRLPKYILNAKPMGLRPVRNS